MQRFTIIGRIGNDLQIKITESNKKVLEFSIVENEKIGNNEITTWLNCVAWEKKAETLSQYCKKGDKIYLEGKIRNQKYKAKDGQERTKTFVLVDTFEFIETKRNQSENASSEDTRVSKFTLDGMDELEFY